MLLLQGESDGFLNSSAERAEIMSPAEFWRAGRATGQTILAVWSWQLISTLQMWVWRESQRGHRVSASGPAGTDPSLAIPRIGRGRVWWLVVKVQFLALSNLRQSL